MSNHANRRSQVAPTRCELALIAGVLAGAGCGGSPPPATPAPPVPALIVAAPDAAPLEPRAQAEADLTALAATEAAGLTVNGETFGGLLAEGEAFERTVTLHPDRCYTALAVGVGDVRAVELYWIALTPPLANTVIGRSPGFARTAIIGGAAGCVPMSARIDVTLQVRAVAGAGQVRAALYEQ